MPLEIKNHTVPHLKGLNSFLEPSTKHGCGCTFTMHHTILKTTHFASQTVQAEVSYERSCIHFFSNIFFRSYLKPLFDLCAGYRRLVVYGTRPPECISLGWIVLNYGTPDHRWPHII